MPTCVLVALTGPIIRQRLSGDEFSLPVGPHASSIAFGSEWPGDALALFPKFQQVLEAGGEIDSFVVLDTAAGEAVGMIGYVDTDLDSGSVEIGYGINRSARGRGFASRAVEQLIALTASRPAVSMMTAATSIVNPASAKVLQRNGFLQVGTDWSEDDGDLLRWSRPIR